MLAHNGGGTVQLNLLVKAGQRSAPVLAERAILSAACVITSFCAGIVRNRPHPSENCGPWSRSVIET